MVSREEQSTCRSAASANKQRMDKDEQRTDHPLATLQCVRLYSWHSIRGGRIRSRLPRCLYRTVWVSMIVSYCTSQRTGAFCAVTWISTARSGDIASGELQAKCRSRSSSPLTPSLPPPLYPQLARHPHPPHLHPCPSASPSLSPLPLLSLAPSLPPSPCSCPDLRPCPCPSRPP